MTRPNKVRDVALAMLDEEADEETAIGPGMWGMDLSIEMGIPAHILFGCMPSSVYTSYLARSYIRAAQARIANPRHRDEEWNE